MARADAIVQQLEWAELAIIQDRLYDALVALLEVASVRRDPVLDELIGRLSDPGRRSFAEVTPRERVSLDERRWLEGIAAALQRSEAARDDPRPELLAAILEEPQDLERRAIYADHLQSIGDPRGEFIALQLARERGALDRRGQARERELQARHGDAWLGAVSRVLVRSATFFKAGFLHAAQIREDVEGLERLRGDPVWTTVEILGHAPSALICAPTLRSLRVLVWRSSRLFAGVEKLGSPTLERLVLKDPIVPQQLRAPHLRNAFIRLRRLPALRRITLRVTEIPSFEELATLWARVLPRLRELELLRGSTSPLGIADALAQLRRSSERPIALELLILRNTILVARLRRIGDRWSLALAPTGVSPTPPLELAAELRALARIPELEVELDPSFLTSEHTELRAAARALRR